MLKQIEGSQGVAQAVPTRGDLRVSDFAADPYCGSARHNDPQGFDSQLRIHQR